MTSERTLLTEQKAESPTAEQILKRAVSRVILIPNKPDPRLDRTKELKELTKNLPVQREKLTLVYFCLQKLYCLFEGVLTEEKEASVENTVNFFQHGGDRIEDLFERGGIKLRHQMMLTVNYSDADRELAIFPLLAEAFGITTCTELRSIVLWEAIELDWKGTIKPITIKSTAEETLHHVNVLEQKDSQTYSLIDAWNQEEFPLKDPMTIPLKRLAKSAAFKYPELEYLGATCWKDKICELPLPVTTLISHVKLLEIIKKIIAQPNWGIPAEILSLKKKERNSFIGLNERQCTQKELAALTARMNVIIDRKILSLKHIMQLSLVKKPASKSVLQAGSITNTAAFNPSAKSVEEIVSSNPINHVTKSNV